MSAAAVVTFGKIIGAILVADQIDTMIGSPGKRALGVGTYDVGGPSYAELQARNRAEGLYNYLRALQDIAPGYVARERPRLKTGYMTAVHKREKAIQQAWKVSKADKIRELVKHVPKGYVPADSK